jgi:flagellar export protein FliJ
VRYRFRLETVLQIRRAEESSARGELARAIRMLTATIEARDRAQERYRRTGGEAVASFEALRRERAEAELAARVASSAQRAVSRAASEAAIAHVTWASAARRVAMLERLDERWRTEHADAEQRAAVATIDDIVSARYAADRQHAAARKSTQRRAGALP